MAKWNEQGCSVLLMLDNVSTRDQVEGLLLPDYRAHRFMITSRDADFLAELPGLEKIYTLRLGVLDVKDAVKMLKDVVRRPCPGDQRRPENLTRPPGWRSCVASCRERCSWLEGCLLASGAAGG
jgi:hypothetical protein